MIKKKSTANLFYYMHYRNFNWLKCFCSVHIFVIIYYTFTRILDVMCFIYFYFISSDGTAFFAVCWLWWIINELWSCLQFFSALSWPPIRQCGVKVESLLEIVYSYPKCQNMKPITSCSYVYASPFNNILEYHFVTSFKICCWCSCGHFFLL